MNKIIHAHLIIAHTIWQHRKEFRKSAQFQMMRLVYAHRQYSTLYTYIKVLKDLHIF